MPSSTPPNSPPTKASPSPPSPAPSSTSRGVLHNEAAEYAIHQAQRIHGLDLEEVREVVDRAPTRPGTRTVRRILKLSLPEEGRIKSLLARRFFRICRKAGLPLPEVEYWIDLPDGHGVEVDFAWPDLRIAVETDGRESHTTLRAFENDRAATARSPSSAGP